jgi:hypothetical protein
MLDRSSKCKGLGIFLDIFFVAFPISMGHNIPQVNRRPLQEHEMAVISLEDARPHLEPLAEPLVGTLLESQDRLDRLLDSDPELHAMFDSSTQASMLSNIFARLITPRLAELGVRWHNDGRMQHGLVGKDISLRFKKLNRELHSMNVRTVNQTRLYHQLPLPGIQRATRVTFGYVLDALGRRIASIFYVCPKGFSANHWSWPLLPDDGGQGKMFDGGPDTDGPVIGDPGLDVGISVNRRKAEGE